MICRTTGWTPSVEACHAESRMLAARSSALQLLKALTADDALPEPLLNGEQREAMRGWIARLREKEAKNEAIVVAERGWI